MKLATDCILIRHLLPQALEELKSRFPMYNQFHDEHDLLRFLRAREFDIEATTTMYRNYLIDYRGASGRIFPCGFCSPLPFVRRVEGQYYRDLVGYVLTLRAANTAPFIGVLVSFTCKKQYLMVWQ